MEEEPNEEDNEPNYDEEYEDIIEEKSCEPGFEGENLVIQCIMIVQEDDQGLRNNIFRTYACHMERNIF